MKAHKFYSNQLFINIKMFFSELQFLKYCVKCVCSNENVHISILCAHLPVQLYWAIDPPTYPPTTKHTHTNLPVFFQHLFLVELPTEHWLSWLGYGWLVWRSPHAFHSLVDLLREPLTFLPCWYIKNAWDLNECNH